MSDFWFWNSENLILASLAGVAFAATYEPAAFFIRRWLAKRFK
jgi:hypothetical protein